MKMRRIRTLDQLEERLLLTALGFTSRQVLPDPLVDVSTVAAADMDGDGDIDALVASDSGITWHENLGGGLFGPSHSVGDAATSRVGAADLDNDGDLDVVFESSSTLEWYENLAGSFGVPKVLLENRTRDDWRFGDVDGDHDIDIVSDDLFNGPTTLLNDGQGSFAVQPFPVRVALGRFDLTDFDNDGDLDHIAVSAFSGTEWFERLPDGGFARHSVSPPIQGLPTVVFGVDIEQDGDNDVVVVTKKTAVFLHENLGDSSFRTRQIHQPEFKRDSSGPILTDIDGDGDHDLVFFDAGGLVLENLDGEFQETHRLGVEAFRPAMADIDGDGDHDIFSAHDSYVTWYERTPDESDVRFSRQHRVTGSSLWSMEFGDVDGDGDQDLFVSHRTGSGWRENLGNNTFGPERLLSNARSNETDTVFRDFDGDGDLDLVSLHLTGPVWFANHSGSFAAPAQIIDTAGDGAFKRLHVADMDLDGRDDIILHRSSSSRTEVTWWRNLGGGQVGDQQMLLDDWEQRPRRTEIGALSIVDVDGDGDQDMLYVAQDHVTRLSTIYLHENLDAGRQFATRALYETTTKGEIVGRIYSESFVVADFDRNGELDIATALHHGTRVDEEWRPSIRAMWLQSVGGEYQPHLGQKLEASGQVNVADLDQDGDVDLVLELSIGLYWHENTGVGLDLDSPEKLMSGPINESVQLDDESGQSQFLVLTERNPQPARLLLLSQRLQGDIDGNGIVDIDDLRLLVANFGQRDATWEQGDLSSDGRVDFEDFLLLAASFPPSSD